MLLSGETIHKVEFFNFDINLHRNTQQLTMYKGFYFRYICMVIRVVWLPPVLNNLAKKQKDFFKQSWGADFADSVIFPLAAN